MFCSTNESFKSLGTNVNLTHPSEEQHNMLTLTGESIVFV